MGDMAAQNAAVGVGLVNNNKFKPGKELYSLGMVGQNPRVKHIGVGNDDPARIPRRNPQGLRRVAVIGGNF